MTFNWQIIQYRHNKCMEGCPKLSESAGDTDRFYTCATKCFDEDVLILKAMEGKMVRETARSL